MERITSRANAPHLCRPAGRVSVACFAAMLIAAGTAVPALAQATMRPQPSRQGPAASPDSKGQPHAPYHSSDMKHHRGRQTHFAHKSGGHWRSSVVIRSGGVTFITGSHSRWHGSWWCDGGHGWTTIGLDGPRAVFHGSSGLRQIGPTFDQLRTFVPAQQGGQVIAPEPTREPTPEERLASSMRARSYDEAQILARQQGDARREAFALLGRGQANEAAELLARAHREKPELLNQPFLAEDWFSSRDETRRLLGLAVRNAHRVRTAEAWFLVSAIMRAEGRGQLADEMMDRARDAERQQRGVVPREPAPPAPTPSPITTPAPDTQEPQPAQPSAPAPPPVESQPVIR